MSESGLTRTPRYFRVLGAAEEVARGLGHSHVGVEHLFLAVLRDPQAVPTQVLGELVDPAAVESALVGLMNSEGYNKTRVTPPPVER
jgi:ATP-dependent Clp protease ATP-binding subunit ClpA